MSMFSILSHSVLKSAILDARSRYFEDHALDSQDSHGSFQNLVSQILDDQEKCIVNALECSVSDLFMLSAIRASKHELHRVDANLSPDEFSEWMENF